MKILKFIERLLGCSETEYPDDPIKRGNKVLYLGVEWTVTQRMFVDSTLSYFELSRINPHGQIETVCPPYWSPLVTPVNPAGIQTIESRG